MEDGPWIFENDVVVVVNFDPTKRIDQYEFIDIPIWFRVYGLSLGKMEEDLAVEIGNMVGNYVDIDTGADGSAVGRFMRVKVRLPLAKPIMRGFYLEEDSKGEEEPNDGIKDMERGGEGKEGEKEGRHFCYFEYEYLPDFCYVCGKIGHVDKECSIKLKRGETQQFGRWLKADMGRRRGGESGSRGYGFGRADGRSRSDSLSLRKTGSKDTKQAHEEGEEVTSSSKVTTK